jgi:hypothetical protein
MLACPEKFEAFEIKRDFSRVSPVNQAENLTESKFNQALAAIYYWLWSGRERSLE